MDSTYSNPSFPPSGSYGGPDYITTSPPPPQVPSRSTIDSSKANHTSAFPFHPPKRIDNDSSNSLTVQKSPTAHDSRFVKIMLSVITTLLLFVFALSIAGVIFILQIKMSQKISNDNLKTLRHEEAKVAANSVEAAKEDLARVQETLINSTANIMNQTEELSYEVKMLSSLLSPSSCRNTRKEFAEATNDTGGIFSIISPLIEGPTEVYCDLVTDEGGWIVFQRRMDGSVDFYRNWTDYVIGFGEKQGEFWLGLEYIHEMTKRLNSELRIDMTDFNGNSFYAKYSSFSVGDISTSYRLTISGFSESKEDGLLYHNDQAFTTKDSDHDQLNGNCASKHRGAWWYNKCRNSNLNGIYGEISEEGVEWYNKYHLRFSEMKIREKL